MDEDVPLSTAESVSTQGTVPMRPGPSLIDSDTWDEALVDGGEEERYHGRRRATGPSRLWVVIGFVLAGLAAAITLPIVLRSSSSPPDAARATAGDTDAQGGVATAELISPAGSSGAASTQPASPSLVTSSGAPGVATTKATSVTVLRFPLTYEAESQPLHHAITSSVAGASGGSVVDRIGDWGVKNGWVDFTVTVPSAGAYTVTVYYMFLESSEDSTRKARINVNGQMLQEVTFNRVTTCCAAQALTLTLNEGANTIRFTHPLERSPAIDKLVITPA